MHDLSTIVRRNKESVIRALVEAVREGDIAMATAIEKAHPDVFRARMPTVEPRRRRPKARSANS